MGCICNERAAACAKIDKYELILEKIKYSQIESKLASLSSIADEYASFFRKLVPHLELIIINYDTLRSRQCSSYASSFSKVSEEFSKINENVKKAIEEIDKEIENKNNIIANGRYTCYNCRKKAKAK